MGLFGKLIKTGIDVVTTPIDIASDVITMGGAANDTESKIVRKAKKLAQDVDEVVKEAEKL